MNITLVSISHIAEAGSTVVFANNTCKIYNKDHKQIGVIKQDGDFIRCTRDVAQRLRSLQERQKRW